MDSLLLEVTATDASMFTVAAAVAIAMAIAAGTIPAIQAVRANPTEALRV